MACIFTGRAFCIHHAATYDILQWCPADIPVRCRHFWPKTSSDPWHPTCRVASTLKRIMTTVNVVVRWPQGLHLRVAAKLVQLARTFRASIELQFESAVADGGSVLSMLLLSATSPSYDVVTQADLAYQGPAPATWLRRTSKRSEPGHLISVVGLFGWVARRRGPASKFIGCIRSACQPLRALGRWVSLGFNPYVSTQELPFRKFRRTAGVETLQGLPARC